MDSYLYEAGISYRHVKNNEYSEPEYYVKSYRGYHHPTQTTVSGQIVILGNQNDVLNLLNHWNRQTVSSGWTYYI